MSRSMFIIGLAALTLSVAACKTMDLASTAASVAQNLSTATPTQVTTLAEAEQAATLVTQAADTYVTTANPSRAKLLQIKALSDAVHVALGNLEAANAAGNSLVFASFNSALQAFNSYAAATATPAAAASSAASL